MVIEEMTRDASIDFVAKQRLGRLACARDGQPYITPIYFAHANNYLYGFATIGQKIEWLRLNPLVCIEADEMESPRKWCSVILTGRYEELPDTPQNEESRKLAYSLLQRRPQWWEPAYVRTILHGEERELEPVYFRVLIGQVSGHRASPKD